MSKKSRSEQSLGHEVSIPEIQPKVYRDVLMGTWRMMRPPEFSKADEPFFDELEGYDVYIIQDDDEPSRFTGFYDTEAFSGSLDLRMLPFVEGEVTMSPIFFTYDEEGIFHESCGGGFVSSIEPGILAGIRMPHMGEDLPIYWKRISHEVPEDYEDSTPFGEDDNFRFGDLLAALEEKGKTWTLHDLFFGRGPYKKLMEGGITTVSQLLKTSDDELLAIRGIGPSTLATIKRKLSFFGLSGLPSYELDEEVLDYELDEEVLDYELDEEMLEHVFTFRVSLMDKKSVWREFELLGHHSLHDLHVMIQVAFNWDDDHLYSFFMSGTFWDEDSAISHPFSGDEFDATEILIASLSLKKGKKFCYLFDFGDSWRHHIEVLSISDEPAPEETLEDYPKLTKSKGEPPEQYPD